MKTYVLNYTEEEQNEYFDSSRSYDGGGYHQPLIHIDGVLNGDKFIVDIDDTSCGGFGRRYRASIIRNGHCVAWSDIDSVGSGYDNEEWCIPSRWLTSLISWLGLERYF